MPSKPTKSILKQSKGGAGPSRSIQAGPSSTNRNTKINAGSKLQKKLNVERGAVPSSSRPTKASRPAPVQEEESEDDNDFGDEDGDLDMEEGDSGLDTDEEIARGTTKDGSSKKASKRKRASTTADTFGSTLTALLSESTKKPKKSSAPEVEEPVPKKVKPTKKPAANEAILSLSQARPPPSRSSENLERKAKRHLQALKEEKEDKARIRDVLEGWSARSTTTPNGDIVVGGQEFEKSLRKTAQRGVIKLFNAILVASRNAEEATTSLSAKAGVKDESARGKKEKDNIMGRGGKETALTQESFLDLVRKG